MRDLHLRAAEALKANDQAEQAVAHFLAASDYARATDAILEIANSTYDSGKLETLAGWLDALPARFSGVILGLREGGLLVVSPGSRSTPLATSTSPSTSTSRAWIPAAC